MGFRKPFRAVPIKEGRHYRKKRERKQQLQTASLLAVAALVGAAAGIGSVTLSEGDLTDAASKVQSLVASDNTMTPDAVAAAAYYRRCADARAAGVAPLRRGQPGYRNGLDRDGDGIACEPYRGS